MLIFADVCELDVILLIFTDIAGDSLSNFMRVSVVCEVRMIGDDKDGVLCAFQEVVPMFETADDCQELPIVDWVSLFHGRECLGMVPTRSEDRFALPILHVFIRLV